MDEINKIPPVTRSLLSATLLVTLPCILQLVSPYVFLLWWQAVVRQGQVWRPITTFFYGGGGISFLFSMFMLLRNSTELETNKFYRKTSEYAWALLIINALLLAINYPLGNAAMFNAFQMAIIYLWSRANVHASVNLMGMVNCPAKYLPYVYLGFDLLQGGMPAAMRSATGLLAAHIYYFLDEVLPATNGGRGPRYLPAAPSWLRTLLPDSLDPNAAGHTPQPGGTVRAASAHTAFAPAGRSFGAHPSVPAAASPGSGRRLNSESSGGGFFGWIPAFGRGRSSTGGAAATGSAAARQGAASGGGAHGRSRPDREAMLAAAEARLRALRDSSIAGRNQAASAVAAQAASSPEARARASRSASASNSPAAPSATAGSVLSDTQPARTTSVSSSGGSEAIRRAGAGSGGSTGPFTFGQARKNLSQNDDEELETASGSGGRVAEIRRAPVKDATEEQDAKEEAKQHSWGSGRQLSE